MKYLQNESQSDILWSYSCSAHQDRLGPLKVSYNFTVDQCKYIWRRLVTSVFLCGIDQITNEANSNSSLFKATPCTL